MPVKPWDANKIPTVVLDFDGVIHDYSDGWQGPEPTGTLIRGAYNAIIQLKAAGVRVEIFSTRPKANIEAFLKRFAMQHLVDEVRDGKPYYIAFFDDRAHHVPSSKPYGLKRQVEKWLRAQGVRA